jgi:hypothetical protein
MKQIAFGYPHVLTRSADLDEGLVLLLNLRPDSFRPSNARKIAESLAETCVEVNCDYAEVSTSALARSRVASIASEHPDKQNRVFCTGSVWFARNPALRITSEESHMGLVKKGAAGPEGVKKLIIDEWKSEYLLRLLKPIWGPG